jgi:hypothetical protein
MSDEGGVMLSDAAPEAAPQEVTPWRAKRLSVNGGRHKGNTVRTMRGRIAVPTSLDVELIIKPFIKGAYAGECLSFGLDGKRHRAQLCFMCMRIYLSTRRSIDGVSSMLISIL